MKLITNRRELLAAAKNAAKIAPTSSPLEILKCILLSAGDGRLTIAATSIETALECSIPAEIEEDGSTVVDAKLLCGMLDLLEGETVLLQMESHVLSVKGKTAVYDVVVQDAGDFPRMEIPFPEDTVPVTGIPAMAKRTVFAVAQDNSKPMMKCVHLIFTSDGLKAVGSDSYRIAVAKGDSKSTGKVSFLMPAQSLNALAQMVTNKDLLRVGSTGKTLVFMKADFLFSARLIEGEYFDADQILNRLQSGFTVLTDAEKLRQAVSSVAVLQGKHTRFSIAFQGSTVQLSYESEYGVSSMELEVVPLAGVPAGKYWYTPAKLMECLRVLNGTLLLEVGRNGVLLMRTDDLICVQMAIREPGPIEIKSAKEPQMAKKAGPNMGKKDNVEKPESKPKCNGRKKKEEAARKAAA